MGTATPSRAIVRYDFRRPNKFSREHVRALQIVNETFARQWTTLLSTSLRAVSQVTVRKVEQQTYDEYVRDIPNPSYLAILALQPLAGSAILHLPLPVVMAAVDRLVGGPGSAKQPRRAVTEIEASLLRSLMGRILRELAYGFESLVQLEPQLIHQESNPQFAQIASASDMVVVVEFDVRMASTGGVASLCIPFSALQPVLDELTNNAAEAGRQSIDPIGLRLSLEERLNDAPLPVSVRFTQVTLTASEIVALTPGDLVSLHHHVDAPLDVAVSGVSRFQGRAGRRGKRLACLVLDTDSRISDGADHR
ncbi:MAG: Flagellar motor switch protein FliM [Acidimicrobiales bacterium]|jgi:flagellar motor switch protein FliM|nr:Flagellar motor switch protein FliM [Acidimicrobiales bacterium]